MKKRGETHMKQIRKYGRRVLAAFLVLAMQTASLLPIEAKAEQADTLPTEAAADARVFYVDSAAGDDSHTGLREDQAWKTLEKVNAQVLQPGDTVLFRAGSVWNGEQLKPQGSGTEEQPITIGAYGAENTTQRPIFNGNGLHREVVWLCDVEYYNVSNLEITNQGAQVAERRAVFVENTGIGAMDHIHLTDLYIHDVNGRVDIRRNEEGGIICMVTNKSKEGVTEPSKFHDLLIENNKFVHVDYGAVFVRNKNLRRGTIDWPGTYPWVGNTKVVIRGNHLDNMGGDGIVMCECDGGLVEYNVAKECHMRCEDPCAAIWCINSDNSVFQFNEAYLTRKDKDGQAYDADGNCHNTCFQYNYSHDNEGGFMLICNWYTPGVDFNDNGVIRYNISQNDRSKLFHYSGINTNFQVYNNTFYVGPGNNTTFSRGSGGVAGSSVNFYNNIFYNEGSNFSYDAGPTNTTFDNNLYYGNHPGNEPKDPHKIIADPMLLAPGTGGIGLDSVGGYKLLPGSPCIDAGKDIPNRGTRDYFGNPIADGQKVDIGAHEFTNDTPNPDEVFPVGTVWNAKEQFSDVSGQNCWSAVYFDQNRAPHITTWKTNAEKPAESGWMLSQWLSDNLPYGMVDEQNLAVYNGREPARCFQSPVDGTLEVKGQPKKFNINGASDPGDDGVDVSILKNDQVIWGPKHIAGGDSTGIAHDLLLDVQKGDEIYFLVGQVGVDWYDIVDWCPEITYVSKPFQTPDMEEGSFYVDDSSNQIQYTDMTQETYLSEQQAYARTAHVSNQKTARAEYAFEGTGIQVIGIQNQTGGTAEISLYRTEADGTETLVETVECSTYADAEKTQACLYEKKELPFGSYRIVVSNKANETGKVGTLVLDAFVVYTKGADGEAHACKITIKGSNGTVTVNSNDGSVENGGYVLMGKPLRITVQPLPGFYAKGLLVNDTPVALKDNQYEIKAVNQDLVIEGVFAFTPSVNHNVALHKPVEITGVISTDKRYGKDQAVDGNTAQASSGWEAMMLHEQPASIMVDLKELFKVNEVKLYWNYNPEIAPSKYTVEISADGKDFKEVANVAEKALNTKVHPIEPAEPARYVRVSIPVTKDGTLTWNSLLLHELEVYADLTADKTELQQVVAKAEKEAARTDYYAGAYLDALNQAIKEAKLELYDTQSTDQQVRAAVEKLQNLLNNPQLRGRKVAEVEKIPSLEVSLGTTQNQLALPEKVTVKLDNGQTEQLAVVWKPVKPYDGNIAGDYVFEGTLQLTENMENPDNLKASVKVTVKEQNVLPVPPMPPMPPVPSVPTNPVAFQDVHSSDYYYDAVRWAVEQKITSGVSERFFAPNESCTRAQAVTFLWRACGSPTPATQSNPFSDVAETDYYYEAVLWAVENGITKGTSAATFSPNESCTRAQIVTFLWRTQNAPMAHETALFADVAADAYYADAVAWAVACDITRGTGANTFDPDQICTRGQIVTFLYRCLTK